MSELRSAKLLSATLLTCAGAVCVVIGGLPTGEYLRSYVGLLLLAFGIPMLVRQWTGHGVMTHLRNLAHWIIYTPWLIGAKPSVDKPLEAESRA